MAINLIVFAGFYSPARHAVHFANTLAQSLHGQLVLLHVNRASEFDPYELMAEAASNALVRSCAPIPAADLRFTLESGSDVLGAVFPVVDVHRTIGALAMGCVRPCNK